MADEETTAVKPASKKYKVQTPIKADGKTIPEGTIIKLTEDDAAELVAIGAITEA